MLTTAQVWAILLIHVGVILVVTAYYSIAAAVWPRLSERASARFAQRPWLAALVGVLVSLPWAVASLVLIQLRGPAGGIGVILGLVWIGAGLVGGAGVAMHLGRGGEDRPISAATIRGGLLLTLSWALPLLGWFVALPLTLATGVGCLLLGLSPLKPRDAQGRSAFTPGGPGGATEAGLAFFHDT